MVDIRKSHNGINKSLPVNGGKSFRALFLDSLPATARTPRNRWLPAAERALLEACKERKEHGRHHERSARP